MRKLRNIELNRKSINDFKNAKKIPLTIILDNIRSLHNIGSVFRSADAFLVGKIILCGITATPPHKDIHKTALGATDSVSWSYKEDAHETINQLKSEGYIIISIEQTENSLLLNDFEVELNSKYAIIFGNEVKGIQQSIVNQSDIAIEIPQFGTKHSINVSVCAGLVIWDIFNKFITKGLNLNS